MNKDQFLLLFLNIGLILLVYSLILEWFTYNLPVEFLFLFIILNSIYLVPLTIGIIIFDVDFIKKRLKVRRIKR